MRSRELIEIAGELRGETATALRFYDGSIIVWLPRRQAEWNDEERVMILPEWLAIEKGLL